MTNLSTPAPALAPTTIVEVQESLQTAGPFLPSGGATKPALSTAPDGVQRLQMSGLAGIQEYQPGEFTITALAGTKLQEIASALAEHGQYLPFDPPLVRAGATLGGTVAAGLSGSGRYRFGGLRDFIIGVQMVDGAGRLIRGGGKVVKNAAGFDLPKLMVGSLGRLGVLVEVSFKVFPAPPAWSTVCVSYPALKPALEAMAKLRLGNLDLMALDLVPGAGSEDAADPPTDLLVRIGGPESVLPVRADKLVGLLGRGQSLTGEEEAHWWENQAEFAWVPAGSALVKVPTIPQQIEALDAALAASRAQRRYLAGGSVAAVAWPGPLEKLDALLRNAGLAGLVLRADGETLPRPLIGVQQDPVFRDRIVAALDPSHRFLPF